MKETAYREKSILNSTFFTILSLVILLSAILLLSLFENYYVTKLKFSHEINYDLYDFFGYLQDAENGQRGYIITVDETYLEPYYTALSKIKSKEQEIVINIKSDPDRLNKFKEILNLKEKKIQELIHTTSLVKLGKNKEALDIINSDVGQTVMTQIRRLIGEFKAEEHLRTINIRNTYYGYKNLIYLLFFLALLVAAYNYYTMRSHLKPLVNHLKKVNGKLQETIDQKDLEIKERMRVEMENDKLMTNLNKKNQELNHFAYIASHDLQEPLRTIKNFIQLYSEEYGGELTDDGKSYFDFIIKAANRMSNLIHGLLLYSKIGSSDSLALMPIGDLVNEATENLTSLIEDKNAKIEIGPLPTIKVYKIEIVQLFQNLIHNAIKFCKTQQPIIQIGYVELENEYEFYVADNGIGIAKKDLGKIFNMFSRLHNEKVYAGQGIGLAFCKKIVELHDGKISAKSILDQGTTFYFTISKDIKHV